MHLVKGKGKEKAEWGGGAWSYSGVTADLRSGGALAEGVEVVGGAACFGSARARAALG